MFFSNQRRQTTKFRPGFYLFTPKIPDLLFTIEFSLRPEGFFLDKCASCLLAPHWFVNNGIKLSYLSACTCAKQ